MPFYHDAKNQAVYAAPESPNVSLKNGKHGEPGVWKVSARIEITRADNYLDPSTNRWRYAQFEIVKDEYHESRDDRETAIRFFKCSNYPSLPEISEDEYRRLRKIYDEKARQYQPPR